jgi:hypothetical protein
VGHTGGQTNKFREYKPIHSARKNSLYGTEKSKFGQNYPKNTKVEDNQRKP